MRALRIRHICPVVAAHHRCKTHTRASRALVPQTRSPLSLTSCSSSDEKCASGSVTTDCTRLPASNFASSASAVLSGLLKFLDAGVPASPNDENAKLPPLNDASRLRVGVGPDDGSAGMACDMAHSHARPRPTADATARDPSTMAGATCLSPLATRGTSRKDSVSRDQRLERLYLIYPTLKR